MISYIKQNLEKNDLNQCQRIFHGRGHAYQTYEHVNVDWLSPIILITLYQAVDKQWLAEQVLALSSLTAFQEKCLSIQAQHRYQKYAPIEVLWGETITSTTVEEHGLNYHIQLGKSQNIGLFLDMANGRKWLLDNSQDKNILNLFAYTCAFSVVGIAGGAKQVINIDMAKAALAKGRENHKLNKQDLGRVKFEGVDIFKSYGRLKKHGPYDILVCDPPSFQKGSVDIERDYKKIIRRIPLLVKPQADILLCLNSPDLDESFLLGEVARECPDSIFQEKIINPEVFVEAECGKGLKVLRFKYLP
ncbi:class I SAM-dependent methyltransferase [Colwellia sp. 1_MG-2023]|uniref:class I SAM-dependent methyltransferase n=1 Tax=Colwellia sp. 1_MG-2023 TaxID=3062649 RepID=UPI0026E2FB86|nr:class I SAM-dependent methyltransferase [Colwellia sp. 1_MG-2023]MDO6444836.1 class I SAM-dependent methyltransferase [Colwellia sp. 1_MG-2023]